MPIRNETTSSEELLLDSRYHIAALLSDPETESLAPATKKVAQALRAAAAQTESMEGERVEAQALLVRADLVVDKRVRQLDLDLLAALSGQRGDERYRQVFPRGASTVIALRGAEESAAVELVVKGLQTAHPELYKRHGAELKKLAAAASAAEDALIKLEAAADQVFTTELAARRALVRQLQKNEGALTVMFPGDRAAVRSFFRATRRRQAEEAKEPEPAVDAAKPGSGEGQ